MKIATSAVVGSIATACIVAPLVVLFMTANASTEQVPILPGQMALTEGPPANHKSIIFGATWTDEVAHAENEPVDCHSKDAGKFSQCIAVIPVNAPIGATHAMLKVKVKAWVRPSLGDTGPGNALIYARAPLEGYTANHFIHCEISGGGPDGKQERRRVEYSDVFVPIKDGTVTLQIGKRVSGRAVAEIAVYLTGYFSSEPTDVATQ